LLCRPGRDATQGRFSPCMPAKEGTKRVLRGGQYSSTNHSSTNLLGRHLYRSPTYWKGLIYSLPPNITPPSHHSRFRGQLLVGTNCHCTVAVEKNASQWRLDHEKNHPPPSPPPPPPCPRPRAVTCSTLAPAPGQSLVQHLDHVLVDGEQPREDRAKEENT
jgi:hypothetical protein